MHNYLAIAHPRTSPEDLQEILQCLWQRYRMAHFTLLLTGPFLPADTLTACIEGGEGLRGTWPVETRVAHELPMKAIHRHLAECNQTYDGIILCTACDEAWMDENVPQWLHRKFQLPVTIMMAPGREVGSTRSASVETEAEALSGGS